MRNEERVPGLGGLGYGFHSLMGPSLIGWFVKRMLTGDHLLSRVEDARSTLQGSCRPSGLEKAARPAKKLFVCGGQLPHVFVPKGTKSICPVCPYRMVFGLCALAQSGRCFVTTKHRSSLPEKKSPANPCKDRAGLLLSQIREISPTGAEPPQGVEKDRYADSKGWIGINQGWLPLLSR